MLEGATEFPARRRTWVRACALLLAEGCLATRGWTQQPGQTDIEKMSVEELMNIEVDSVYGASKFEQKVTKAPSYVTVISADEIAKQGYRTLADLLRSVPGFYVTYDRNYSYVGVRGFARPGDYNDRILLLIDGHRLNENVYESADAGTEIPLDMDLVKRVEIIRGPGSALYGTDAFFAVINMITKRGGNVKGAEISGGAGSLQTFSTRATYGDNPRHGPETLFSGTFYHSLGDRRLYFPEFDTPETNNGIAVGADGDGSRSFFASLQYKDFSLQGLYGRREKAVPTASFGSVFNDSRTRTIDTHGYLDLKYDHTFGNRLEVLGRFGFDEYDYHGTYVTDYAGTGVPPFTLNQDFGDGQWLTFALDVSRTFYEKHRITLGTETRWNLKQDQENFDAAPYVVYLDDHRSSTVASFYLQDEFSIRRNLILSAGFRYDQYYGIGGSANPRLGLIYSPWEKTSIKLLYGQAFRAPNVFEMYYSDGISEQGNPALQPETIKTTELILEQYFTKHTHVAISAFYNSIAGLITEQTNPTSGMTQFVNLENVRGKGLDFEWAGKWPRGWEGRLAYTVQDTKDQSTGSALSNSPKHLPKINVIAPIIPRRLFASLDGQYVSRRESIEGTPVGGFFVANATLSLPEVMKGLSISASAYNVFDKRYADPGRPEHVEWTLPQEGRTLRLKLTYRFKK